VRSFSPIDSWAYFPSIVGCSRTTHSRTSYHGPQWRFLCRKGGLTISLLSYFPFPVVDFVDLPSTHGCSLTHAVRFFGGSPSLSFPACSSRNWANFWEEKAAKLGLDFDRGMACYAARQYDMYNKLSKLCQ